MNKEVDTLIKELFIKGVCKEYSCGSQRCDCSDEWLEGCKLYKEFETEVKGLITLKLAR